MFVNIPSTKASIGLDDVQSQISGEDKVFNLARRRSKIFFKGSWIWEGSNL